MDWPALSVEVREKTAIVAVLKSRHDIVQGIIPTMECYDPDTPTCSRILVVDDDPEIRGLVSEFLRRHGFLVEAAEDGPGMERALAREPADLVVLDLMLPGEDGLSLTRRLAAGPGTPVIILSAMGEDTDRIVGLEVGADDYLAKPCNPRELLARVRAVLRRNRDGHDRRKGGPPSGTVAEFAGWRLDLVRRELRSPRGVLVELSNGEATLLRVFVERPQRILTRDQLLEYARGPDTDAFDRAVDVQISRLRRKLAADADSEIIRTVRNEGYLFLPRVVRP
jgi:two-component system, OmpR family, response regulator